MIWQVEDEFGSVIDAITEFRTNDDVLFDEARDASISAVSTSFYESDLDSLFASLDEN